MRTALLIGNGQFPESGGKLRPLAAPRNDVLRLSDLLARDFCGYLVLPPLLDEESQTLRLTVEDVVKSAGRDDLVLIYYAGHGEVENNQLYLCTRNTRPGRPNATALPVRDLWEIVRASTCKTVLILDCCFSGKAIDQLVARSGDELSEVVKKAIEPNGWYVLTSSDAHEPSYESGEGEEAYGIYTRCLLEGLATGDADLLGDGRITTSELAEYAAAHVRHQTPRVENVRRSKNDPEIARNPWKMGDQALAVVQGKVTRLAIRRTISTELFDAAMVLSGQEPLSAVDRHRKRLLLHLAHGNTWDGVFAEAWEALGEPGGFRRWLTERVLNSEVPEDFYLAAMELMGREPDNEFEAERKQVLTLYARLPQWRVEPLLSSWNSIDRRRAPEAPAVGGSASEGKPQALRDLPRRRKEDRAEAPGEVSPPPPAGEPASGPLADTPPEVTGVAAAAAAAGGTAAPVAAEPPAPPPSPQGDGGNAGDRSTPPDLVPVDTIAPAPAADTPARPEHRSRPGWNPWRARRRNPPSPWQWVAGVTATLGLVIAALVAVQGRRQESPPLGPTPAPAPAPVLVAAGTTTKPVVTAGTTTRDTLALRSTTSVVPSAPPPGAPAAADSAAVRARVLWAGEVWMSSQAGPDSTYLGEVYAEDAYRDVLEQVRLRFARNNRVEYTALGREVGELRFSSPNQAMTRVTGRMRTVMRDISSGRCIRVLDRLDSDETLTVRRIDGEWKIVRIDSNIVNSDSNYTKGHCPPAQ